MSKKKIKISKDSLKQILGYSVVFLLTLGLVFIGSRDKNTVASSTVSMNSIAAGDYNVSTDQISEFYMVASLSNAMNLASVETVSSNYVTVSVMKGIGQTGTEKIEKPNIVDTSNIARGVVSYTVKEGETMASIAGRYGITTEQIRWSNKLKTEEVSAGQVLVLPSTPGIVYTVKDGDSLDSIAEKYGTNKDEVVAVNDLENRSINGGMQLVLPGGSLPEAERPEYVAPVRRPTVAAASYSYTYFGSTSDRENLHTAYDPVSSEGGNPMSPGQCTWYAWWWRYSHGMPLPGGPTLGSARSWAATAAAAGYAVDRTPSYGAVFQTTAGYYGHVGIVTGVNSDGSIIVREMNYNYRAYVVTESTIPANIVGNFYYIH